MKQQINKRIYSISTLINAQELREMADLVDEIYNTTGRYCFVTISDGNLHLMTERDETPEEETAREEERQFEEGCVKPAIEQKEPIKVFYIHTEEYAKFSNIWTQKWDKEYPITIENAEFIQIHNNPGAIKYNKIRQRISSGYVEPQDIIETQNGIIKAKKATLTHNALREELVGAGALSAKAAMFYAVLSDKKPMSDTRTLACKNPMQAYCYACFEGRKYHPETFKAASGNDAALRLYRSHISNIPAKK